MAIRVTIYLIIMNGSNRLGNIYADSSIMETIGNPIILILVMQAAIKWHSKLNLVITLQLVAGNTVYALILPKGVCIYRNELVVN